MDSRKISDCGRKNIGIDYTCVGCRGEVILVAEAPTSKDPMEVERFKMRSVLEMGWC